MRKNPAVLHLPALLVLLALLLAGCKDFSFYGVLGDRFNDTTLRIVPATASVAGSGGLLTFTATGGAPPYSYSVVSGTGSIDAVSGIFTANAVGADTVRVTDSKGSTSDAVVTVSPSGASLQIAPPIVSLLVGGSVTFYVSGGTPPYTFSVLPNNSGAPPMTDEDYTAGLISGVTDTVQVQDGAASTATASVNVVTAPVADVDYRVLATNFLPASGIGGQAIPGTYNFTIQNNGTAPGAQPVAWWVFISEDSTLGSGDALLSSGSAGALPAGGSTVPPIDVGGTWPAVGGNRWLFVLVAAGDDLNSGNNASSGSAVTLAPPDINYELSGLAPGGSTTAGGDLSGTFDLTNTGASDGSQPVSWTVYVSTNSAWEDTDPVVDAGSVVALGAGLPYPGGIAFDGTWPAAAGNYYLIVRVFASDEPAPADTTGNELISPIPGISVTEAPIVDYAVTDVNNTGGVMAGGDLAGNFSLQNVGAVNGAQTVYYQVYASYNDDFLDSGDTLVASGSRAPLNAGVEVTGIGFAGTWPSSTGLCYLIVVVVALDDANSANNVVPLPAVEAVTLVPPVVDYAVSNVNVALSALPPEVKTQAVPGGSVSGTFQYSNSAALSNGVAWLSYAVYASTDQNLSGDDLSVASGSAPPLAKGQNGVISFSGTWPLAFGNYYLIAWVGSPEDSTLGNNWASTSAPGFSVGIYDEPLTDLPIITVPPLGNGDYGLIAPCLLNITFRPGMSVRINGDFSTSDQDDIFAFNTGTATALTFHMTWTGTFVMQLNSMDGVSSWPEGVYLANPGSDHITWVWTPDAGGTDRWLDVQNGRSIAPPVAPQNVGPYVLTITAN